MFKFVLQTVVGMFSLALSTLFTWYEGSGIIDHPWDWKYSTPFSDFLKIKIVNGYDISQLDYFVYAAKYQPLFPVVMLLSVLYILAVFGYYLIKHQPNLGLIFWGLISCTMILFSSFIFNSTTVGGKIFFLFTFTSSFICVAITFFLYFRNSKLRKTVDVN